MAKPRRGDSPTSVILLRISPNLYGGLVCSFLGLGPLGCIEVDSVSHWFQRFGKACAPDENGTPEGGGPSL